MARESGCKIYGSVETKHKYYVSQCNVADKELYDHPTIKPLEMIKNHIINSTKEGDVVLDCFCGSGTTCVACKELGRHYIGMELNPKYYQIAVDRLNGISQKEKREKSIYGGKSLLDL
jgi:DNA modification methylase